MSANAALTWLPSAARRVLPTDRESHRSSSHRSSRENAQCVTKPMPRRGHHRATQLQMDRSSEGRETQLHP